jgi:hypothetical protein
VQTAYSVLARILDDAMRDRLLASNPARGVKLPKRARRHRTITDHTPGPARALIAAIPAKGRSEAGNEYARTGEMGCSSIDPDEVRRHLVEA